MCFIECVFQENVFCRVLQVECVLLSAASRICSIEYVFQENVCSIECVLYRMCSRWNVFCTTWGNRVLVSKSVCCKTRAPLRERERERERERARERDIHFANVSALVEVRETDIRSQTSTPVHFICKSHFVE